MGKRALLVLLSAALVSSLFSGCARRGGERQGAKRIGVSLLTREHVFYKDLEEALVDEGKNVSKTSAPNSRRLSHLKSR